MQDNRISVREIEEEDIDLLIAYWLTADHDFLRGMGVDIKKLPDAVDFRRQLEDQLHAGYEEKKSYCIIWLLDGNPAGHSNVNKIVYGEEAYMHLHIWYEEERSMGLGLQYVKETLPYFFNNLRLKKICCEPYALNPAPNKTLEKLGFKFIKEYTTVPGWLNFEQPVKLWELSREDFRVLH